MDIYSYLCMYAYVYTHVRSAFALIIYCPPGRLYFIYTVIFDAVLQKIPRWLFIFP